jgi:hypothetical protein
MTTDCEPVEHFDGDVYWYRRLPSHPQPRFVTAAKNFRDAVAKDLGLCEPYPDIAWYEPIDHVEAATAWSTATLEYPNAGWGINDNPFTTPVNIFRFPKNEQEAAIHGGYTHKDGPRLIGILTKQPSDLVFECIAHECVHVRQDDREGLGWRLENILQAETEAWAYQDQARSRFFHYFENITPSC